MARQSAITGLDDVMERMQLMRINMQKKYARKAARKAMNIARDAARQKAKSFDDPDSTEKIYKNIVVQQVKRKNKNPGEVVMSVGIKGGAYANTKENRKKGRAGEETANIGSTSNPGGDTFYWRFKEFGTAKMAAEPFMRPALADNIDAVTDDFASTLQADIMTDVNS